MLPRDTEQVWNFLKDQPALAGFVLVGGSALTLRIDHRVSEDLDLTWTQAHLPRNRLGALRHAAEAAGFRFQPQHDEAALQDFAEANLDLLDYQQNYLVMRHHGFTLKDYCAAFSEADLAAQCDIGLSRLCSGLPQKDDEGYAHLLSNPPTLAEMKAFFVSQRDQWEVELAAEAKRRQQPGGG